MSEPVVLIEQPRPGLSVLTLNRPDKRNALDIALLESLCAILERLGAERAQRVFILQGSGPAFCAGLDLREAADPQNVARSSELLLRAFRAIRESPLVSIAAAHGAALAGGGGLLACCDLAIAANNLKVAFPEVRRGLVAALVATLLKRKLRDGDLRELLLLAESIDANRSLAIGLVNQVVAPDALAAEAVRMADQVLQGAPGALWQTKRLLADLEIASADDWFDLAMAVHRAARQGDEAQEGLAAFLEKRQPCWSPG